jgi:cytochrome c553
MKKILATIILAATYFVGSTLTVANEPAPKVSAAPEPTKTELMARGQQIAGAVCVACHGLDGMSPIPNNPNIAGMPPQYIAKQLQHYKEGSRKNAIMAGMAAGLSPADMKALGEYYFAQRPKYNAVARDKALAEKGQKIYRAGIAEAKVPACAGCHGGAGAGIPALYPRLAGQWPEYSLVQLKAYASGERKHAMMNTITARMRDNDILAVSEYLAGMRPQ